MNPSLQPAVHEVLNYLAALQQEGVRPPEARARLQPLRGRHPSLAIDLLSEEEAFDQSIHYDALLQCSGEGTVSLSYCPERVVPWPLRGVHPWSEGDLVHVNANVLRVDAAIACVDFIWSEASMIERLVNMCLIQEELDRNPLDLTDAELQHAMDQFRSAKKLYKTEDTLAWLERNGMTHEKLETYVKDSAIVPKLRDRITAGRVEEYFHQHSRDFDTARIARLDVADESQARGFAKQIRAGELSFFAAAECVFLEAAERTASHKADLFATVERRQVEPALREQLFAAAPGQLVGPVPFESGHALVRVMAIFPAQLNERAEGAIKDILFNEWLAEQRQAAHIEWCWGNASRASNTSRS
jgi:putative peptide maturation system protein